MHPELVRIGPVTIYSYGTAMAVAILVATWLVWRQAPREGIDREITVDFTLGLVLAGLIGSRLAYVILNWSYFAGNLPGIFSIGAGGQGLTIHGGLLGGATAGWVMARRHRLGFWPLADLYARGLAAALGIGRIGCLLAGCCYGQLTNGAWGCTTIYAPGLRHPSQAYETALLSLLFVFLSWYMGRPRRRGQLFGLLVAGYGCARFAAEVFRESERVLGPLSLAQLVSLFLVSVGVLIWSGGRQREVVGPPAPSGAPEPHAG